MASKRSFTAQKLANGSVGDPVLYLDYPGSDNALLFDAGDNASLTIKELSDLEAVFISHHHVDHFIGLDRILRANMDHDKILTIIGPDQTIERVFTRWTAYDHRFFPFSKLEIEVRELHADVMKIGRFGCGTKLQTLDIDEQPWRGPVCYETSYLRIEAIPVEHTAPCLAYALVETPGYHPDVHKLQSGDLKIGPWVGQVLKQLRTKPNMNTTIPIGSGVYRLGTLAEEYFTHTNGSRVAFVTDTLLSDELWPNLVRLTKQAAFLYCDSFYAKDQAKEAAKHKHMMAWQAAELAAAAKVEQLVLIHHAQRYAGQYDLLLKEAAAIFPRVRQEFPLG